MILSTIKLVGNGWPPVRQKTMLGDAMGKGADAMANSIDKQLCLMF